MRPICTVVDGLPSGGTVSSFPGPFPVSEMSLLRALGPVQTWLGQELEKCGIDAMIYTRYVLSLLLHDSYDYDLQEQENDIFLGWEKGVCKKWGKGKKKNSDLSLEEMKKQAAVQCLLSASDESSGIETLVEELCSKLKDLQRSQDEQLSVGKEEKSIKDSGPVYPGPVSPAGKDQAEMYYAAFPPLSEKPVCLQEIMTVWNKSKVCSSSSSSSSTAPQTSTETPSPKDCNSESETIITTRNGAPNTVQGKHQPRKGKIEKENKFNGANEDKMALCKSVRHKFVGKARPRSWSSGSSEGGSSSSGNPGDGKQRLVKVKHKIREVRSKRGKSGQKIKARIGDQKSVANSSNTGTIKPLCKRVKRQVKESAWKGFGNEGNDISADRKHDIKFREEPLWYTEPITEYLFPQNSRSKLETTYRKGQDDFYNTSQEIEELSEYVHGLHLSNHNIHQTYLPAGTFIEGHFVEVPAAINETSDHTGTSNGSLQEDSYLDDVHPLELTHFYEVEIDQSMLDPGASEKMQGESRILNMIRQKNNETGDLEAESCKVLNEKSLQGESAIWREATSSMGAEGFFLQDHDKLAQFWDSCSPSSSADADGESLGGDSPDMFSSFLDSTTLSAHMHAGNQDIFFDGDNSYFSVFEVQCGNSVFSLPMERVLNEISKTESCSSTNVFGKTQSRLLIWTKNSAFDESEQCSNISTRTCSPWSHSEEARSDTETFSNPLEEYKYVCGEELDYLLPRMTLRLRDEDCCEKPGLFPHGKSSGEECILVPTKTSKLESLCGIQLEKEHPEMAEAGTHTQEYSSGGIKDLWINMVEGNIEKSEDPLFPVDVKTFICEDTKDVEETFKEPNKAVQRSEYHLWEGQNELLEKRAFLRRDSCKVDLGDYTAPSKPWECSQVKENSFILGGVYGEFQTLNGEDEWAVVPPSQGKGNLLECSTTDVVTIAGTDVFMTPGSSFAPGQRPFWRPFVSFEESPPPNSGDGPGLSKAFSFILHENLLGACNSFQVEDPGMGYSFSSFELNNRFSQVLHVECSFEPGGISAGSPNFKPKSLLSDPDGELGHPKVCGFERTQYRSIRISPRTHFRPISASELSPGGGSESDFDSEKDEAVAPALCEEVFDDPQDDLQPLEEDAENEGHFYGKAELESGKFLPKLQKSGMEKSAQTSLDCQEESCDVLEAKQDDLNFRILESFDRGVMENSKTNCKMLEANSRMDGSASYRMGTDVTAQLGENPSVSVDLQGVNVVKQKPCWWQKALYSPLIYEASCESDPVKIKEERRQDDRKVKEASSAAWHPLEIEKASACNAEADIEYGAGITPSSFRKKIYSSDSSSSDNSSDDLQHWADLCRQKLYSRTQL
uniref:KIAA0232 n=1 Tax=Leptobrachium leishanense TaxID=445787 RepID=A0A8C5LVJ1_9ANUR